MSCFLGFTTYYVYKNDMLIFQEPVISGLTELMIEPNKSVIFDKIWHQHKNVNGLAYYVEPSNYKLMAKLNALCDVTLREKSELWSDFQIIDYFPLQVGNSWTYTNGKEEKTFTIIGTKEINGHTYYKFDDYWIEPREGEEFLFRWNRKRVLMWDSWWYYAHGLRVERYNFSDRDGWGAGSVLGIARLKQRDVTCNVPAGEFSNCINFQFLAMECGPDAYQYGEYLAPYVGNVKYVEPGGAYLSYQEGEFVTFKLKSYKNQYGEYLAPNVGNFKYVEPGDKVQEYQKGESVILQPKSYKIIK